MISKRILALIIGIFILAAAGAATFVIALSSNLPEIVTVKDYKPLLVSEAFDINDKKIGEFAREKRTVVPFDKFPEKLVQAFIAAEDSNFYEHGGVNYIAMIRAMLANFKAGEKVQGASTITQQVARSLLLTREKTYIRKIREILLAYKMEANLSKQDIMYLYLNQIFLGGTAYGVAAAADVYFRKPLDKLEVEEMAILAGLPKAPSAFSPVYNPKRAKERQVYVLERMAAENFITEEESKIAIEKPLKVYLRLNYTEIAPYYLETVRQYLVKALGESMVLDKGIRVFTAMDLEKQTAAKEALSRGLRELDKRQGYRGPIKTIEDSKEIATFLLETRDKLMDEKNPIRIIKADGTVEPKGPLNLTRAEGEPNIPPYIKLNEIVDGIVINVDDKWGITTVRFAEGQGLIDVDTMKWASEPNPELRFDFREINKPSKALKPGDVIKIKVVGEKFASTRLNKELNDLQKRLGKKYVRPEALPDFSKYVRLELEQEPLAQGALISLDNDKETVAAMIGGYDFEKSEFNRAVQALRQSGSAFKILVFASALDKGYTPTTSLMDSPLVYGNELQKEDQEGQMGKVSESGETWKPGNYSEKFGGDVLFRNALKASKNVPTVKILEDVGIPWVAEYTRRLGITSPINMDLSLGLGSSSITLYEMTKVFSHFARLGKRTKPIFIRKVENNQGEVILENVSLDMRFEDQIKPIEDEFEEKRLRALGKMTQTDGAETTDAAQPDPSKFPPIFFEDPKQLISPQTAYLMTDLLKTVIWEDGGTGGAAKALGRPSAGKTGTTSGYFDTWFVGYTPDYSTGVWVGYDDEKTLGVGETGGRTALPIWTEFMQKAHENLPKRNFRVPEKIVFAKIDMNTGYLASASSGDVVEQAFLDGTEPKASSATKPAEDENVDFFKQDLSE
jgi:penicillin-binding protein 1A